MLKYRIAMKITPKAKLQLEEKLREATREFKTESKKKDRDLTYFQKKEKEVAELEKIVGSLEVVEFSETEPPIVIAGSKVVLESLGNGDKREYIIATRYTADPVKGIISDESPLAQKILNLKLGNTFKFRDYGSQEEIYKIKTIEQ